MKRAASIPGSCARVTQSLSPILGGCEGFTQGCTNVPARRLTCAHVCARCPGGCRRLPQGFDSLPPECGNLRQPCVKLQQPFAKLLQPLAKVQQPVGKLLQPCAKVLQPFAKLLQRGAKVPHVCAESLSRCFSLSKRTGVLFMPAGKDDPPVPHQRGHEFPKFRKRLNKFLIILCEGR